MDEIIYLEPDEEITSVVDKIKKSRAKQLGLVIPRSSSLIHSLVNLKLLKKEADGLGKAIALVTADKVGKNIAHQIGLDVYPDIHALKPLSAQNFVDLPKGNEPIEINATEAPANSRSKFQSRQVSSPAIRSYVPVENSTAESGELTEAADGIDLIEAPSTFQPSVRQQAASRTGFQSRQVGSRPRPEAQPRSQRLPGITAPGKFLVGLIILTIIASFLGLPQSTLTITAAAESYQTTLPVIVSLTEPSLTDSGLNLPGKKIEYHGSAAKRFLATGKKEAGTKAKGQVTLYNAWDGNPITLAAGTTLTDQVSGKLFVLPNKAVIPGGSLTLANGKAITNPGKVTVELVANEPGDSYNVKAGKLTIGGISSDRQASIYGETANNLTGGASKQITVLTQADITTATETLQTELLAEALPQLRAKLESPDFKIVDESVQVKLQPAVSNPEKLETETEHFDLKLEADYQAIAFNEASLKQAVLDKVTTDTPEGKTVLFDDTDSIGINYDTRSDDKLILKVEVKTKLGQRVDLDAIASQLPGQSLDSIKESLLAKSEIVEVTLNQFPLGWWQDFSYFSWNTRLKLNYQ
ncbi:MAG: Uncharacterized protein CEO22_609 [Candidatus Berkelbacteria bacterium Gr01-1014_85]|uniref:Baseplate protein J-like domain-containing protein n=1 Tax=Candidatus Berkelbacteria bacterium Gr01-1014_85 TaxID=2017150 RepID=A0A554J9R1_9BACT|nr:MAG: Uncharacterized protein CEO22_609 [Candidatus Berkelbacteria bacterium Gr01-1014_85]